MKNYIIAGIFLVFLAGASLFLPSAVMKWQDEQRTGKSETEEVQEVVLKEQISMSLSEKLRLREQETVNMLDLVNGKNYNQDTINAQVRKEIEILAEQGILLDFDMEEPMKIQLPSPSVHFYVDMEDSERSIMMWEGYVQTSKEQLDFLLDDETGKIVSFSQLAYERTVDYIQMDGSMSTNDMASVGSGSKVVERRVFNIEEDEMEELAERWSEYLGCEMTDFRSTWTEMIFGEEKEEFLLQVESLIVKGYTPEEAEKKVALQWGIVTSEKEFYADFEDEGGQVGYVFWRNAQGVFQVGPVLE